jgi:hypothetical protein
VFGQYILLYLQLYLIYYGSGCGRRQIAEPPKIMCFIFCFILSSNSFQWTEIHRAVRFDAVPLLSQKIPPIIGAVYGNCTSSFGVVMSQFIREFKDEGSLLQRFYQEQQTIFLFITTGSTVEKRRGNILVHMLSDQSLVRLGLFLLQASIRSLIKLVALLGIYLVSL